MSIQKLSYTKSKQKLAVLWLIFSGVLFLLLIVQTILEKHGANNEAAWNWLLGALLPTLSLMIGAFVADFGKATPDKEVGKFLFRLAFYMSLFYLIVVAILMLGQPATGKPITNLIESFSIPLQAFQGLVSLILGVFFVKN